MFFFHYKIKNSSAVNHIITGNFSGFNKQEIIVSRGRILEVLKIDSSNKLCSLLTTDFNATILSLALVRGLQKDYVAVGSDSGKVMILEFKLEERCFEPVKEHKFNEEKEVSYRFTPGQYLAVDEKSQTLVIGAIEETLVFYSLSDHSSDFGVPVTVEKPRYIFYDLVSVYNEMGQAIFATLEAQYQEQKENLVYRMENQQSMNMQRLNRICKDPIDELSEQFESFGLSEPGPCEGDRHPTMFLRFYDCSSLEINQKSFQLTKHANKLISVPPNESHKGGVLICSYNELEFFELETEEQVRCYFPQRKNMAFNNKEGLLIVCSTWIKWKDIPVVLLQSEEGDLYSATVLRADGKLTIKMTYIDTILVSNAMCTIKNRLLFLGTNDGNHCLFKIKSLGLEEEFTKFKNVVQLFLARKLTNLEILARMENLTPVINCLSERACNTCVLNPADHACNSLLNFYFTCGRGPSSSLRTLRHGVEVKELFAQKLPHGSFPVSVWTITDQTGYVANIVISLNRGATMVLSVGPEISLDPDAGFKCDTYTLSCVQVDSNASIQVYPSGFRYIQNRIEKEWSTVCCCKSQRRTGVVIQCAVHHTQIALSLLCKELMYLEVLQDKNGSVSFKEIRGKCLEFNADCMEFVPCNPKAEFLLVCTNNSLHLYSVGSEDILLLFKHDLLSTPSSIVVTTPEEEMTPVAFITIGFEDGSVKRAILKGMTIQESFSLKLDSKRVKLVKAKFNEDIAILALSSRAWITFNGKNKFDLVPLLYDERLDFAASFSSVSCSVVNLIAISNEKLVFLFMRNFCSFFQESIQRLQLTPRACLFNSDDYVFIICQKDYRPLYHKDGAITPQMAMDLALGVFEGLPPHPKAERLSQIVKNTVPSNYDNNLLLFDPIKKEFVSKFILPENYVAHRICLLEFDSKPKDKYVLASIRENILIKPTEIWSDYLFIFKVLEDGKSLSKIGEHKFGSAAQAICSYQGLVLIGFSHALWLCDFQDKLHLISSVDVQCSISNIYARGRLFITLCSNYSVSYGFWNKVDNTLNSFHDDRYLQSVTSLCFFDDDIIVASDLKGNLNVVLLPQIPELLKQEKSLAIPNGVILNPKSTKEKEEEYMFNIEDDKFMSQSYLIAKYHIGEIVTSLQTKSFINGGREVIFYTTLSGTIGVLVPFLDQPADIIFKPLQFLLKGKCYLSKGLTVLEREYDDLYEDFEQEQTADIIDGNLCDLFNTLSPADQWELSYYLQKDPFWISEKIAELKSKIYFGD